MTGDLAAERMFTRGSLPTMAVQLGVDMSIVLGFVDEQGTFSVELVDAAGWALAHLGQGGWFGGSFAEALTRLAFSCDPINLTRLARGFPEIAVVQLLHRQLGTMPLVALARDLTRVPITTERDSSSSPADTDSDGESEAESDGVGKGD